MSSDMSATLTHEEKRLLAVSLGWDETKAAVERIVAARLAAEYHRGFADGIAESLDVVPTDDAGHLLAAMDFHRANSDHSIERRDA